MAVQLEDEGRWQNLLLSRAPAPNQRRHSIQQQLAVAQLDGRTNAFMVHPIQTGMQSVGKQDESIILVQPRNCDVMVMMLFRYPQSKI